MRGGAFGFAENLEYDNGDVVHGSAAHRFENEFVGDAGGLVIALVDGDERGNASAGHDVPKAIGGDHHILHIIVESEMGNLGFRGEELLSLESGVTEGPTHRQLALNSPVYDRCA